MKKIDYVGQNVSDNLHTVLVHFQDEKDATPVATINLSTTLCLFKDRKYIGSRIIAKEIIEVIKRLRNTHDERNSHYVLAFDSGIVSAEKKAEKLNDTTLSLSTHNAESIKIKICDKLRIPKDKLSLVKIYEQETFLNKLSTRRIIIKDKYFSIVTIHLTNV